MTRPATLIVLAGVAVVLTFAGAFDTDVHLRLVPRLIYWAVVCGATYAVGFLVSGIVRDAAAPLHRAGMIALTSMATGVAVVATVTVINRVVFRLVPDVMSLATMFAVATVIALTFQVLPTKKPGGPPAPPALLARIAYDKRGALVALAAQDHYVAVTTTKGTDSVLMRLGDAIAQVGDTHGMQVHRTHWIAIAQIRSVRRNGDGALLTMTHGPDVPVSRANMPKLKEAGLLP